MKNKLFLVCAIAFTLYSCRMPEPPAPESYLRFKMNGTAYLFDALQFDARDPADGNFIIRSSVMFGTVTGVETDFPYWFDIRKTRSGEICAILMPKEFPIPYVDDIGTCDIHIPSTDVSGNPLSMQNVFFYENGTITNSKSACSNRDYFDPSCWCTKVAYMCDLDGKFGLTFKNGLGEIITLTDGDFVQIDAFQ